VVWFPAGLFVGLMAAPRLSEFICPNEFGPTGDGAGECFVGAEGSPAEGSPAEGSPANLFARVYWPTPATKMLRKQWLFEYTQNTLWADSVRTYVVNDVVN
jgi:hypothetical protein